MCGFCMEANFIAILDEGASGWPEMELLEEDDLNAVIRYRASADEKEAPIFCRLMEMLLLKSRSCARLLRKPVVLEAVTAYCLRWKSESARERFPFIADCSLLADRSSYTRIEGWKRLRADGSFVRSAESALEWFVENFIAVADEADNDSPGEFENDAILLAPLITAGIVDEDSPRRRALLKRLITGFPRHALIFDLWLQRRAFLHHARRHPRWIKSYRYPVRPILYTYFAVKTGMEPERRRSLAAQIETEWQRREALSSEDNDAVILLRGWDDEAFF